MKRVKAFASLSLFAFAFVFATTTLANASIDTVYTDANGNILTPGQVANCTKTTTFCAHVYQDSQYVGDIYRN